MPANLSPDYKAAEAAFRAVREPKERLECLREMLRTIPKHKGTEHLQGDIKARIKQLTEELAGPEEGRGARRPGARHPARGGGPDFGAGAAQLREVRPRRQAHRRARRDRPLSVHHAVPATCDAALPGHPLSARRPAPDHPRPSGSVDR